MKMNNTMKYLSIFAAVFLFLTACEDTSGVLEELGLPEREFVVSKESGALSVDVYANFSGKVTLHNDAPWLSIKTETFSTDGVLMFSFSENEGFPRMAKLKVSLDRNPDYAYDLIIRQEGAVQPSFVLPQSAFSLTNDGQSHKTFAVETNVPLDEITISAPRFPEDTMEWVSNVTLTENGVELDVVNNTDEQKRLAVLTFSYNDGWDNIVTTDLHLVQMGKDNNLGADVTFSQLKQMATTEGVTIPEGILTAHVISDVASGNVHENTQVASKKIDYSVCRRSAYVQDLDGTSGLLLIMKTEADNFLSNDTKVTLDLSGAVIRKYENPERYVVEGLTEYAVLDVEDAAGQVVVKSKNIKELTDADIYTRVKLTDVEWPVRKGSLTPCYEFMTNASNNASANKFATLLRGKDGGSMYIYTNTTCPYRRDGSRMGYGQGNVTGVIVHENHPPFEYADGVGNIGDYQIRHMSRADLDFSDSFSDSFSEMICEFRYALPSGDSRSLKATYGEGSMVHTGPYSTSYEEDLDGDKIKEFKYGFRGLTYYDFSYLGPIGSDSTYPFGLNTGTENGFGIILEDGTDYGVEGDVTIIANPEGYGRTYRKHEGNLAWGAVHWWNSSFNRPYFWLVEFSTKNITTDHLSMQLAMLNQCQSGKSPRYWKVEWSLSDITEEDDEWKFISEFTVPDVIPDSFDPAVWMSSAFKPMDIPLPSAMLGHDKVYLRIGPANNKASDRYGYDNATIESSNYSGGTMNYFAIRYNK